MAPKIVRLSLAFGACLVATAGMLMLATPGAAGAQQAGMPMGMDQGMGMAGKQMVSVTGCVQKGVEAHGFYLTDADGKVWELSSKSVKLDKFVDETAMVRGREVRQSKAIESKIESDETKEAAGKPHADLQVTSVKSVSKGCGG